MEFMLGIDTLLVIRLLVAAFLAVLFLHAGFDKVLDWRGNMAYLTEHFARTRLESFVPQMLALVTLTEVVAGLLSGLGVVGLLFLDDVGLAFLGCAVGALDLLMLFFGQRIARDYEGAHVLANYFVLAVLGMLLMRGLPGLF